MPSLKQSMVIALVSIVAVAIAKRVPVLSGLLSGSSATAEVEPPDVLEGY
jgi:hypothetical protein